MCVASFFLWTEPSIECQNNYNIQVTEGHIQQKISNFKVNNDHVAEFGRIF